jgi:hypothetical protein
MLFSYLSIWFLSLEVPLLPSIRFPALSPEPPFNRFLDPIFKSVDY